jgi:hypothetical protein
MQPTARIDRSPASGSEAAFPLKKAQRIVRRIENIDSETLRAIAAAKVPTEYAYPDAEPGLQ